jgi:hypothetical protein
MLGHTTKPLCTVHKNVALHRAGAMQDLGYEFPRTPYTRSSQIMPLSRFDWLLLRGAIKEVFIFVLHATSFPISGKCARDARFIGAALSGEDASPPGTLRALLRAFVVARASPSGRASRAILAALVATLSEVAGVQPGRR